MSSKLILLFAVTIGLVSLSRSYPTGAPPETCKTFTANHTGHKAQNGRSKYEIKISPSSLTSGKKATITIQGDTFKGYLIKAEDATTKKSVGQFKSKAGVAQTVDCSGPGSATAATHVNADDKSAVSFEWQAPQSYKGTVVFKAVIVKTYSTFWNNVQSRSVTIA